MSIISAIFVGLIMTFILVFCGSSGDKTNYATYDTSDPKPVPKLEFTAKVKAAIDRTCTRCHAGKDFVSNANAFKAKGQPMVINGSMPKDGNITKEEKDLLINF